MNWRSRRFIILVLVVLFDAILWWRILAPRDVKAPELYFLDVGQGDSELIRLPGGVDILIDGGPPNRKVVSELSRILPPGDRYIDLVLLTHPQLDHYGGFIDLLKSYDVGLFVGSGRAGAGGSYEALHDALAAKKIPYLALVEGDRFSIGGNKFSILGPNPQELTSKELNDTCLLVLADFGSFKALYTGDIGEINETRLAEKYDLSAAVLKVPHHGSRFSSTDTFLADIHPAVAIIEVGKNTYGHPTPAALDRLRKIGARIFRTDQNGAVLITPKEGALSIFSARGQVSR